MIRLAAHQPTTKEEVGDLGKIKIPGAAGELGAILYCPEGDEGKNGPALPCPVCFHGGGFVVIADAKTYDASTCPPRRQRCLWPLEARARAGAWRRSSACWPRSVRGALPVHRLGRPA